MNKISKQDIDIFTNLSDEEFLQIKDYFLLKTFLKGKYLIAEDMNVNEVYFIRKGLVKLSYIDTDTKENILSFAFENWWETDFDAFYNSKKSTLTLQCLEDTEVYTLTLENYQTICKELPQLSTFFLNKSINGHIANQKRILSLLTLNPKDRYEQFLALYPTLFQRISKSILAQYLGVSRETLSRLYK